MFLDFLTVALIGALVGIGELVSRYRDAPVKALLTWSAGLYVAVNLASSVVALALIRAFDWGFGQTGDAREMTQVLVAGFGALALFRSSLFLVRVGDQDVGVGPSSFLQILLAAADRDVDRQRARARAQLVGNVMQGVEFGKAIVALPTFCLTLMQNVPADVQEDLGSEIKELATTDMNEDVKTLNLGLRLMNVVGPNVLEVAVAALRTRIAAEGSAATVQPEPDAGGIAPLPPLPPAPSPAVPRASVDVAGASGNGDPA
jgi:hypothetical protein